MSENELHSLILACDFRVDDVAEMWNAHHVVITRQSGQFAKYCARPRYSSGSAFAAPPIFGGEPTNYADLTTVGEKV